MGFLRIAAAFHFHFPFFPRVLLDQRELKGVLEDLDLQGKKFVLFLVDFNTKRKIYLHSFLDFHINSSHV